MYHTPRKCPRQVCRNMLGIDPRLGGTLTSAMSPDRPHPSQMSRVHNYVGRWCAGEALEGSSVEAGRHPPRLRRIEACNLAALEREIEAAKRRFELSAQAHVISCYEASSSRLQCGRDFVPIRNSATQDSGLPSGFVGSPTRCQLTPWA